MTADELLSLFDQQGARLSPRIHVEAPAGAITRELLDELAAHKGEILVRLLCDEGGDAGRRLCGLWRAACFELAETLGWPRLQLAPHMAIAGGEALWRIYLHRASVPELREITLPLLRAMLDQIPPPDQMLP